MNGSIPKFNMMLMAVIAAAALSAVNTARADDHAYLVTQTGDFGNVDLNTGAFSKVGNVGQTVGGLGEVNGTLYAGSYTNPSGTIYTVNPATAVMTPLTPSTIDFDVFGSTLTKLYALDTTEQSLYVINPITGTPTLIGSTGLTFASPLSMSTNSNTLYITAGVNLYTLSTTTGTATLVGSTVIDGFGGLITLNTTLYGGEAAASGPYHIDTLNTSTGTATLGSALTGTTNDVWGLAPVIVPEPASLALLGLGAISLLNRRTRRVH